MKCACPAYFSLVCMYSLARSLAHVVFTLCDSVVCAFAVASPRVHMIICTIAIDSIRWRCICMYTWMDGYLYGTLSHVFALCSHIFAAFVSFHFIFIQFSIRMYSVRQYRIYMLFLCTSTVFVIDKKIVVRVSS